MATGNAIVLPRSSTFTCSICDLRKYHHPSLSLLTNTLDHHLLSADHVSWNGSRVIEGRDCLVYNPRHDNKFKVQHAMCAIRGREKDIQRPNLELAPT